MPHALQTVQLIAPELVLIGTATVMLLLGPFVAEGYPAPRRLSRRWTLLTLIAFGTAAWTAFGTTVENVERSPFVVDTLSQFVRGLLFALAPVITLMATKQVMGQNSCEGHVCLLFIVAGACLTALAADLVGLYLALELVSIPTYLFLFLPRRDDAMQEATAKYMLMSILAAPLTLYGLAWLYGAAGSTNLQELAAHFSDKPAADIRFATVALAIVALGLAFRISAAPFHFYAPDVFQGVNTSSAAMLSVIPKVAGFVALARIVPLVSGAVTMSHSPQPKAIATLLAVLALVTMCIGNILALRQSHLHRLLAYSSIAHSGYMLVAFAAGETDALGSGVSSLWFYLTAYGVTTVGLFALLTAVASGKQLNFDTELNGLGKSNPTMAALIAVCLLSLTGIPPTVGFVGKLQVLLASWGSASPWGPVLAVTLIVNSAIAAYYYLRLVALMYFEVPAPGQGRLRIELAPAIAGACCTAAVIILCLGPQRLLDFVSRI